MGRYPKGCFASLGSAEKTNQQAIGSRYQRESEREVYDRNWLTQLWRLTSPKFCSQQAGDPKEPMVQFQSKFEGLRTRRADDINST